MRAATVEGVPTSRRTAEHTRVDERRPDPRGGGGALSPMTLAAASVASVVSAVVVSRIWGPGTLYGAAATPIIVALVSELVQRPRRVIETARHARSTRAFDPVEEGQRGLREGDLASARSAEAPDPADRTVHRVSGPPLPKRRSVLIALATGVLAFGVAAVVLTGTELVFGDSSVGGGGSRTTLFGGSSTKQDRKTGQESDGGSKQQQRTQPERTTTVTTTTPSPTPTTSTPTTTPTTPAQTPPSGGAVGPQTQPPTQTTPAPPAGQPPAQTTPAPTAP